MELKKAIISNWRIFLDTDEEDILTGMYGGSKQVDCSRRFNQRGKDHRFTIHHNPDTAFQECQEKWGLKCDCTKLSETIDKFREIGLIAIVQEEAGKDKNRDCYSVSNIENFHICELKGPRPTITVTPDRLRLINIIMDGNFCSPLSTWVKNELPEVPCWFLQQVVIKKWQLLSAPPRKKRGPYTVTHPLFPPAEFTAEANTVAWKKPTNMEEFEEVLNCFRYRLLSVLVY